MGLATPTVLIYSAGIAGGTPGACRSDHVPAEQVVGTSVSAVLKVPPLQSSFASGETGIRGRHGCRLFRRPGAPKPSSNRGGIALEYRHVDVFSRRAFQGNGLVVVLDAEKLSPGLMQAVTREVRQFETALLSGVDLDRRSPVLRIFTEDEELDFAGHPVVGCCCRAARDAARGSRASSGSCGVPIERSTFEPVLGLPGSDPRVELRGLEPLTPRYELRAWRSLRLF